MRLIALLLLLLLLQPAPAPFAARWQSSTIARVSWSQSARACLVRQPASGAAIALECYEAPGDYALSFGAVGPEDGRYTPKAGDVYLLFTEDSVRRAPLRWDLFIPAMRR